jgi:hypothetical protein
MLAFTACQCFIWFYLVARVIRSPESNHSNRLEMFNNMNNRETMKEEEIRTTGFLEEMFRLYKQKIQ